MATPNQICVSSFNSTGFGLSSSNYKNTLLLFSDVLCVQEHFILDSNERKHSNTNKLRKSFPNFDMHIKPAVKNSTSISRGRGKGGLATIWKPSLTKYVTRVECDNFRLLCSKFAFPSGSILLINAYFPCDPRRENFDDSELLTLLSDITNLVNISECTNILIAGDLNCHLARNNQFTSIIRDHFENLNMKFLWESDNDKVQPIDYTHLFSGFGSTIDHFVCTNSVLKNIVDAGVIHSPDNTSNHSAIFMKLETNGLDLKVEKYMQTTGSSWKKASENERIQFSEALQSKLNQLTIPSDLLECNNIN